MLTYENVINAPVDKLRTAAADWQAMAGKLDELAEAARGGMKAKSDKAQWSGVTAGVGRPFVDKTAKEFEDAAEEAKGVHKALTEGLAVFTSSREQLKRIAAEEAPAAGFQVDATGRVSAVPPATEGERNAARHDPDHQRSLRENRGLWQQKIDDIIDTCDDVDRSLARLLGANVTDAHDFGGPRYGSLDAEQAGRAADLAKKGRDLGHDELVELNELLADNAKVPEFSKNFYEALGPRGALEFFGYMSTDTYDYAQLDEQRLKDVRELQKNLGMNLATATNSTTQPHLPDSYAQELRRLGTQHIPIAKYDQNPPYGYQLLGGIMRYGTYDPGFLVPIAEHATQIHAKDPDFFNGTRHLNGYGKNLFNPSGVNGAGYDPVVSFLEAMGHSPDAAKQFFDPDRTPHAYQRDGTEKSGPADLGKGGDKKPITSYLDFFGNEKYDFTIDMEGTNPDDLKKVQQYMPDALGHALEAATLGHAWDDPTPKLVRDDTSASIMQEVVGMYGGSAELLKNQESMADSLGRMGAGYIDDLNHGLNENHRDSVFARAGEGHAEFERYDARKFLSSLGQHPDSYLTMSRAESVFQSSMLESQVGPDGKLNQSGLMETARTGGEFQGILDESRGKQIDANAEKWIKDYDKALEKRSGWVEFGTTAAIAAGVAFAPATAVAAGAAAVIVPLAVDTGSGALEQMAGGLIQDWSDAESERKKDQVEGRAHEDKQAVYQNGEELARSPVKHFLRQHPPSSEDPFDEVLKQSVLTGYNHGWGLEQHTGNEPVTEK
ncbi:hypothetical protein GCM10010371_39660 [Streptomyces subrutilus]|uniref:AG2 protein n=1 Tax=Streptomyces subrutilus TaxID=36818 RepID=A0A5P2USB0_9ACTN|nr:hypothetical protein [Streptomyces subrutilus]QEU80394.1 hypothetical protein CP968_20690 [Streptomyces subrutilus]GGZ75920.1 hypothetical protein GCM10010371_39660 [Streptomyces subrutilus]